MSYFCRRSAIINLIMSSIVSPCETNNSFTLMYVVQLTFPKQLGRLLNLSHHWYFSAFHSDEQSTELKKALVRIVSYRSPKHSPSQFQEIHELLILSQISWNLKPWNLGAEDSEIYFKMWTVSFSLHELPIKTDSIFYLLIFRKWTNEKGPCFLRRAWKWISKSIIPFETRRINS